MIDFIKENPKAISILRKIKNSKFSDNEIDVLEKKITDSKTKVLIVAAGMGSRLKGHTENLPKCMLDFGGKTLIERQLLSYKECGLNNISWNIDNEYTEKQYEAIMDQAEKIAKRALIKINADWKNSTIMY